MRAALQTRRRVKFDEWGICAGPLRRRVAALRPHLRAVLSSRYTTVAVDSLIVANVVVLLVVVELGARNGEPPRAIEVPTTIFFDVVFIAEASLFVWCFGSRRYLSEYYVITM